MNGAYQPANESLTDWRPAGAVPRQIRWRTLVSGCHSRDNLRPPGQAVNDTGGVSILWALKTNQARTQTPQAAVGRARGFECGRGTRHA